MTGILSNNKPNRLSLIEEDIRKLKLKEAKKLKSELEQKLLFLNESVENLTHTRKRSSSDRVSTKEELEKKQRRAEELVMRMEAERKERKKREEQRLKAQYKKAMKELKEQNDQLKEQREEMLRRRREDSMKAYEQLRRKRQEEMQKFEEVKGKPSPVPENYLYKQLADKYEKEVLMPTLENRKKELAFKRSKFKPIVRKELDEHLRKYEHFMLQKDEQRQNEQKARKEKEQELKDFISKLKTRALKKELLKEQTEREEKEQRAHDKQELRAKMINYAKVIQETHPVSIDTSKAEEMKRNVQKLASPPQIPMLKRKTPSLKLRNVKPISDSSKELMSLKQRNDRGRNKDRLEVTGASKTDRDPLAEFRRKREARYGANCKANDWTLDLSNRKLSAREKYERLMKKASNMEQQAMRQEEIMKLKGNIESNMEIGETITDMYLDSIKAKLAILTELK
eukprot:TRINITY_DN7712_c0_g1_i1.p1 TRINITY_DN7712_c0_g1~~TRINITY_DN7712_c0_g1_i1.p1  ORF type:complete len:455 (-),score=175.01 TRINITY_DN7712_c0_g1_i1:76-1440(-)